LAAEKIEATRVSIEDLLRQSDFVTVHCPLTPETKGMFNETLFKQMKPTAIFINTSRGGVVDQEALYRVWF
jgi:phosphoglycerate dehydrogenase-like enzyme